MTDFTLRLDSYRGRVNHALLQQLPDKNKSRTNLQSAMHYAATTGGKRIRPILTYATGNALGIELSRLDIPACAVELMHAYSLVHDDLPAMDNDDLRRGNPTCHIKFNEATAILAGDALQALAFTLLATNPDPHINSDAKLNMIKVLGMASGAEGMAQGQAIDLESVDCTLSLSELEDMHQHKTGALIRASVLVATMTVDSTTEASKHSGLNGDTLNQKLDDYAGAVGLAFQIVDDILDVVGDTHTLGKTQGADEALNKPTYPALLGLEGARQHALDMHNRAVSALDGLDHRFDELRMLSDFVIQRTF